MAFTPTQVGGIDADRYGIKKSTDWVWVPVIVAATFVPSEAEINDGTLLSGAIEGITGFNLSARYADLADLVSDVDGKVFDGASLDDSSISFYQATSDDDALSFFTVSDEGFLLHCPRGLKGAARAFSWKVEVSTVTPTVATTGGSLGSVGFAPKAFRKVTLPAET